nr:gp120=antigenic determinant {V3 variable region} [human immunodeficiency virus type 1 HIV-1, isolate MXC5/M, Peptide Partial, 34 aa] [Human immunodeficiency virus 1]
CVRPNNNIQIRHIHIGPGRAFYRLLDVQVLFVHC